MAGKRKDDGTTARQDGHAAVFPELPSPLKRIYVKSRDLNGFNGVKASAFSSDELGLDRREKTAFEVGLKFEF